ncbi:protease inhibitor-like [Episyrphus balteatus]|uniref:protease inhibitor-like n=1 Tax=Episyrphus balteatus TaxID=286459 RepID=UPI002484FB17|nr:protease inhibitor-like [Episyrphus balteatus]
MKFLFALIVVIALIFVAQAQVDKAVCAQPKDVGPCRSSKPTFYFNNESKACEKFLYGGCMGNDNRFPTKEECEAVCL